MVRRLFMQPRSWWAAALRGIIAIVLGLYIVIRPASFGQFLTILAAAYVLINGALALAAGIRLRDGGPRRHNLLFRGGLAIIVGALALALPLLLAQIAWVTMLYLLAIQLVLSAVIQLAGARDLRRAGLSVGPALGGALVSLILAAFLFAAPLAVGAFILRALGFLILVYGVLALVMGLRVRRAQPPGLEG